MVSSAYIWAKILGYLEDRLSATVVSTWFDDAEVVELTEHQLILYTPSEFRREMIENRCADYIKAAMKDLFDLEIELTVLDDSSNSPQYIKEIKQNTYEFNNQYTFDTFVVGPSNEFTHGAAIAVANHPAESYNPLFIYGQSGLGKTHLLNAIAVKVHENHPEFKIVFISGEQFTNEMIAALRKGENFKFRNKYRNADLFLMDDIQFIAGKDSTQEEFFHTFNTLFQNHKQIVVTSDRSPSDMTKLEDRLRTRFEGGLITDIQPPDYETRMAIIKNKALRVGLDMPNDVCSYIAENITANIRQIEGTVKKIMAYRELAGMQIDVQNVSRAIKDMYKGKAETLPTPGLIISEVSRFYAIEELTLRSSLKNKGTAEARQVAMYMIRTMTNLSLPDIGKEFGRDHSTVIHSIKKIEQALKNPNSPIQDNIRDITANINNKL